MPIIRVEPSGAEIVADVGETIFAAARRQGYSWPTVCGGEGSCRACVLTVLDGAEGLSAVAGWEREGLDAIRSTLRGDLSAYRLACQVTTERDVVVRKIGVRKLA